MHSFGTLEQSLPCHFAGISISDTELSELLESEGGSSIMMNRNRRIAYVYIERARAGDWHNNKERNRSIEKEDGK